MAIFGNEVYMENKLDRKPVRFDIQRKNRNDGDGRWYVYRSVYNDCPQAYALAKIDLEKAEGSYHANEFAWRIVRIYAKPKPKKLTYEDRLSFVNFALQELDRLKHPRSDYQFWAKYILATLGFKEKV